MPAARLERYGTRKALPLHEALPYTMARPAGAVYVEGGDEGKQAEEEPPSIMPPAWTERALNERQPSRGRASRISPDKAAAPAAASASRRRSRLERRSTSSRRSMIGRPRQKTMIRVVKRDEAGDDGEQLLNKVRNRGRNRHRDFPPHSTIVNPNGFRKFCWDCVICVVLFYAGIITPFIIAFVSTCRPRVRCPTFWIDCLCDGLFAIDIGINLNTAFFDAATQRWVLSRWRISRRYAGGGAGTGRPTSKISAAFRSRRLILGRASIPRSVDVFLRNARARRARVQSDVESPRWAARGSSSTSCPSCPSGRSRRGPGPATPYLDASDRASPGRPEPRIDLAVRNGGLR